MRTRLFTLFTALLCSTAMMAYDLWVYPLAFNLNAENQTAEVTYQVYDTFWHDYNQGRSIVTANIPETVEKDGVIYTVTSIGDHAFENCEKLTSVAIPNTVTSIGQYAFARCPVLAEMTIPNRVRTIGDYAFKDCYGIDTASEPGTTLKTGLRTVNIGSGVTSIGVCAFYSCSNLTAINVSAENLNFSSPGGVLMSKYKKILITYPSGKEGRYNIPTTVTTIKAWAFQGGGLTGISIPNTVTVIEDHAFDNCYGLQRDADGMRYADTYLIEGSANATSCTVKDGTRWIGYHAFSGCNKLTSVSIPNSVTAIGSFAFRNCTSLSWLYIPETVANINSLAFQNVPVIEYYGTATGGPWGAKKWIGQTKEVYTEFDRSTEPRTLTYYYDNRRESRSGVTEVFEPNSFNPALRFYGYAEAVQRAVIDPSMKDAPLTNLSNLFYGGQTDVTPTSTSGEYVCLSNMTTIEGLENLNTANVEEMHRMFYGCSSLESIDLSSFNTANAKLMASMFEKCRSLKSLDLTSFNTKNMVSAVGMFYLCENLTTIYCNEDWSTNTNLEYGTNIFTGCPNLVGGYGTQYNINNVDYNYARPDGGDQSPGYFTATSIEMYTEFDETTGTLTYYFDNKHKSRSGKVEFVSSIPRFEGYNERVLKAVIDPSMKNSNATSLAYLFNGGFSSISGKNNALCNMTTIEGLENLNTADVVMMNNMFEGCSALTTIDLSTFNTEQVMSMGGMFKDCSSLKVLDLTSFNIGKLKFAYSMFNGCKSLTTIYCSEDWSKSIELDTGYMFDFCDNLVGGKGTAFVHSDSYKSYTRPDGGTSAPGYFTKKEAAVYTEFDEATGTLTYRYDDQFNAGSSYVEFYDPINHPSAERFTGYYIKVRKAVIDKSMKNANLTSMESMFFGGIDSHLNICNLPNMTTIEGLENLNTANVTNMSMMFMSCASLLSIDVTTFDVSKVTDMSLMFSDCKQLMTIYCNEDWSVTSAVTKSNTMFHSCNMLIGGHGTGYIYGKDIAYAHPDGGEANPGYFTIKGDANGDSKVSITDAVGIVNCILGNPSSDFSKGAANLNGDLDENGEPNITITDAVGVVNIILNSSGDTPAPAMDIQQEQEPVAEPE